MKKLFFLIIFCMIMVSITLLGACTSLDTDMTGSSRTASASNTSSISVIAGETITAKVISIDGNAITAIIGELKTTTSSSSASDNSAAITPKPTVLPSADDNSARPSTAAATDENSLTQSSSEKKPNAQRFLAGGGTIIVCFNDSTVFSSESKKDGDDISIATVEIDDILEIKLGTDNIASSIKIKSIRASVKPSSGN